MFESAVGRSTLFCAAGILNRSTRRLRSVDCWETREQEGNVVRFISEVKNFTVVFANVIEKYLCVRRTCVDSVPQTELQNSSFWRNVRLIDKQVRRHVTCFEALTFTM